jgi:hypothetical protein
MSGFKVNFSVNNQLATPAIHAAALVNRPAAGQPGRVFIDTDNPSTGIYRDTGTIWIQIAATSSPEVDTLQTVTDRGNTTDNTLILTYDSLFNGSNAIEFFDTGTTATRYSITKQGTGNRLTLQGNSPLSTNDMGLMIDAPNNTLRTYWGSSFNTRGISCDFTNNIYRLGNISGTAGQQGIYVDATGSVGIGTTSPTSNSFLTIQSAAAASQLSLVLRGHNTTNAGGFRLLSSDETTVNYSVYADTTVGLSFSTTSSTYVQNISFATGQSGSILGNSAALYIRGAASRDLSLGSNNTNDRMIIKSGGNVLIGTTTDAGQKLQITGTMRSFGTSTTQVVFEGTNPANPSFIFNGSTNTTSIQNLVSRNFDTSTDGSSHIRSNFLSFYTGAFIRSWQQDLLIRRTYPNTGTGSTLVLDDSETAASAGYKIQKWQSGGIEKAFLNKDGDFATLSTAYVGSIGTINASAIIQADSTTKGFLPPRMTNAQMTAIVSPATGLMVYDTTNSRLNVYDGSNWISLH